MAVQEHCLRCGKSWSREPDRERRPCPGCSDPQWDTEFPLDHVGRLTEYEIVEERSGRGLVISLDLIGARNPKNNTTVPLPHRLKKRYRHMKGDLGVKDGRECVIVFDKSPDGQWEIVDLRRKAAPREGGSQRARSSIDSQASRPPPAPASSSDLAVPSQDPLVQIRPPLAELRTRTEAALRGPQAASMHRPRSGEVIQKEIWGIAGGIVTEGLFGRRSLGSRFGRALASDAHEASRQRADATAMTEARSLVYQARDLVEKASPVIGHHLTRSLFRALDQAESATRPETVLRRSLQVVLRLQSWRPASGRRPE